MSYIGKKGYTLFKNDINSSQIKKIRDELTVKPFQLAVKRFLILFSENPKLKFMFRVTME